MALLPIRTYPDPVLAQVAKPVESVTPELVKLSRDMLETMYAAPGVGLAAPQVGESVRLLVIDIRLRDDDGNVDLSVMTESEKAVQFPLTLFNPVILKKSGSAKFEEGCLSVPGYVEEVSRSAYVECEYLDAEGKKQLIKTDGLLAVCIQHELDHLEGILFIDRLGPVKKTLVKNKIKKNGYPDKSDGKLVI